MLGCLEPISQPLGTIRVKNAELNRDIQNELLNYSLVANAHRSVHIENIYNKYLFIK